MIDRHERTKNPPLLPIDRHRDSPLFFVIMILTFLASLAALLVYITWHAADKWTLDLSRAMTIQIKPNEYEDGNQLALEASKVLKQIKGIKSVEVLPRSYSESLLKPWFGEDNLPDDLPLPYMIDIRLDPYEPASSLEIREALNRKKIKASVDDHNHWAKKIKQAARGLQTLAFICLFLLISAIAAAISFAAKAVLVARRNIIHILHLSGAQDLFVSSLFTLNFFKLAIKAGFSGSLFAGISGFVLWVVFGAGNPIFLPTSEFRVELILILFLIPFCSAIIGALTAWRTTFMTLRKMI